MSLAWKDVEIPKSMRTLERDRRGYPIPSIVMRDITGRPHFTINDHAAVMRSLAKRLCAICGKPLRKDICLVGGLRCFTSPNGAFLDPPTHHACATYALRVCPFLAAPSYSKRIDDRTLSGDVMPSNTVILAEQSMIPDQPPLFGLGRAAGIEVWNTGPGQYLVTATEWLDIEVWRNGERIEGQHANGFFSFAKEMLATFPEYAGLND